MYLFIFNTWEKNLLNVAHREASLSVVLEARQRQQTRTRAKLLFVGKWEEENED